MVIHIYIPINGNIPINLDSTMLILGCEDDVKLLMSTSEAWGLLLSRCQSAFTIMNLDRKTLLKMPKGQREGICGMMAMFPLPEGSSS